TLRRRSVDVDVEELRRSTFALETRGNLAVRVHQRVPEALLEAEADHAVLDDGQLLASAQNLASLNEGATASGQRKHVHLEKVGANLFGHVCEVALEAVGAVGGRGDDLLTVLVLVRGNLHLVASERESTL